MKLVRLLLAAVTVSVLLAACTPALLYEETIPNFSAPADKALCVVIRTSGMNSPDSPIWIDGKLVSGTARNTITSFKVDPGEHLVLTKFNIMSKCKLNFKAGKVYYILQTVYPVPMLGMMTSLVPLPCNEAAEVLEKEKDDLKFTKINPEGSFEDLPQNIVNKAQKDWKEWAEDEPEKAKKEIEYEGC